MKEKGYNPEEHDISTSPEDRARLLTSDAVSLRSTSSTPGYSFFRNRIFSFGSNSAEPADANRIRTSPADATQYTGLDETSASDTSTILGAPRRNRSGAQLHSRHQHSPGQYGALASSTSLSSCASQVPAQLEVESLDPRLFSENRTDRYKAKAKYYLKYYFPILTWLPSYPVKAVLVTDILAGLTIASFNMPLSLSYARTLCYVPERYGLLGFAFPQLVYAFMSTVPVMITGPEPGTSVMVGQAITPYIFAGNPTPEEVEERAIIYVALITLVHTIVYMIMGFLRLGFLDALLSAGLLRGFLAAVGIVLTMDTLIPALGLSQLAIDTGVSTQPAAMKLAFIITHLPQAHGLSAAISFISFGIIIFMRWLRSRYAKQYRFLVYVPDILMIIVFTTIMAWKLRWDQQGLVIVGQVDRPNIEMMSPLTKTTVGMFMDILTSGVIISLLGFFQTAVVAKNIFPDPPTDPRYAPPKNPTPSANRELVALGFANLLGTFMFSLPSIGGYGRSKANKIAGARTQLSSIVFALSTIVVTFGLLPLIYYLPRPTLAAVLGLICLALLEDAPGDIIYYFRIHAWADLAMVGLVIGVTLGVSLQLGVTIGIGISVIQILSHATKPRIQVLARVPGTASTFRNADRPSHDVSETDLGSLEHVPGVLLVRIPEPLMFANTSELEQRLRRLERYGTMKMHPSLPATRRGEQNVIVDLAGMSACDTTAVKVLCSIVSTYRAKGKYVLFARLVSERSMKKLFKRAGLNRLLSYNGHPPAYFQSIDEALEALDECVFETPGSWVEEDDISEPEEEKALDEDDLVESVGELETEVESVEDEKVIIKREMV
ncbi:sulfate transporter family-domain-containing protein [Lipomyces tetrasporus]|uniref:Sulfate transporter family-domain-containing protein n=1 Tax=Lipomyces tetrasporus TaxID=54092 RepID=A0AAD7QRL6_9ASCO|nr:sulfate transporter family-domain-containing protein [Lipomyces tetrasporus]KAJ8100249.1 sulfate transporter family-domain-containing protein [Lipomyces tetrasporus]